MGIISNINMSTITNSISSSAIIADSPISTSKLRRISGETIKLDADSIDEESLRRKITQILLEDPDSEIKKMAEDYLIQCIYEATEDPESNPILQKFFGKNQKDILLLKNEVQQVRNEVLEIRTSLNRLKNELGVNPLEYNGNGIVWRNEVRDQFGYLENKLINITEKLEKEGININYWEN